MLRNMWLWMLVVACAPLCGCGGGTPTQDQADKSNSSGSTASPKDSVVQFLQAVKDGDDKIAEKMLTSLARQKTAEFDIAVATLTWGRRTCGGANRPHKLKSGFRRSCKPSSVLPPPL